MINIFKKYSLPEVPIEEPLPEEVTEEDLAAEALAEETSEKAETSRIKDRNLFTSLLAGLYDGILIIDSRGSLLESNQRARDFFGYEESDLWYVNCKQLIPQLNTQLLFKIQSHINENRHTIINVICRRKDDTQFPAEIAISLISMINEKDIVLSIRNCEKRVKAQKSYQIRNDVVEHAGAGMLSCSEDGTIKYANPAFMKMVMAESMEDILRHKIGDFCPNPAQHKELLECPSKTVAWHGKMNIITMRDTPLQVQATSVLTETHVDKKTKQTLVITMTLLPAPLAMK